jgi:hypothetical protein
MEIQKIIGKGQLLQNLKVVNQSPQIVCLRFWNHLGVLHLFSVDN